MKITQLKPSVFFLARVIENRQTRERSSSCRGMAFEIKSLADPFAIKIPWLGSPKEFPSFIQRSISKSSSHFCDIDLDDEDHEDIG